MKRFESLSEDHTVFFQIDLQKNKKLALLVNGLSLLIATVMILIFNYFVPITTVLNPESFESFDLLIKLLIVLGLMFLYVVLHEAVHGVAMKICGTKKIKFGLTALYAYAGSDDYYDKNAYVFIALAPVVLWGAILAAVNFLVQGDWVWIVFFIQVFNVSGAAGDYYVTAKMLGFPKDILIRDHGVGMTVYAKKQK